LLKRPNLDDTLLAVVTAKLELHEIDCSELVWDSSRREDGRWNVTVAWNVGSGTGYATWLFDQASQSVIPFDDEARWLTEESVESTPNQSSRPRLVGLPIPTNDEESQNDQDDLEPPAWAGPGHPTIPVSLPNASASDDSPSWDDILFGYRPTDS